MLTNARYFSQATWCILIGVNNYSSERLPNLRSPQNDVGTLRKSLINLEGCAIPANQVLEISGANGQVSKADATDMLEFLTPSIGKDDLLILFFAGHGITKDDDFVLCFSDTDLENTPHTAITGTELDERLNQIKCRGVLVILDCCQGAGFAEFAPRYFRSLGESDFRILLTSTKTNELSWEGLKGTFFTQFLVEAIDGRNIVTENPGLIHFSELLRFIQDRLFEVKEADRVGSVSQTPVFAGVYPKDPLIFVNRKITLEGIAIKITRYTKEYIRRVITRGVLSLLVAAFIFFGMWYTMLDKTEYAEVKNGYWAVYKGKAGINAFGFPKLIRKLIFLKMRCSR